MKILLNGDPLEISGLTESATLADVLAALETSLEQSGLTVMEVEADGEVLSVDQPEELGRRAVHRFEVVDFHAMTAAELVRGGVQDSLEVLCHLEEGAAKVSSDLRLGHVKKAMNGFLELLDGLDWLVTILRNLQLGYPQAFLESSRESVRASLLERWEIQVLAGRSSQEAQDWVGLADIIEYEFAELLTESRDLLTSVSHFPS